MTKLFTLFALLTCFSFTALADEAATPGVTLPDGGRMFCASPDMNAFLNDLSQKIVANWKAGDSHGTYLRRRVENKKDGSMEIGFYVIWGSTLGKHGYYTLATIQASAGCAISQ